MRFFIQFALAFASLFLAVHADFWLNEISHQGVAPYAASGYTVFRNVKDYGAVGDGVTDDTAAINNAITAGGGRCFRNCASATTTPAIVYFPSGTYLISSSIIPYYFTMLIGDANNRPILKATAGFAGFGLIDGNPYTSENLNWVSVNVFYKQIRNFIIDTTGVPSGSAATGVHWPVSQATSIQNVEFNMPEGSVHVGLFIESGSGGFMADLTFNGGKYGAQLGNQQYTMRNLEFNNPGTAAIQMLWDWDWTFMNLTVNNAPIAVDMSIGGSAAQAVGSVIIIDSTFTDVDVGVRTAFDSSSAATTNGSLVLENVVLINTPVAVQNDAGTVLAGGTTTISAFAQGHTYTLTTGPTDTLGPIDAINRPCALLGSGNNYYTRSKPQYESLTAADFVSVRSSGAVGNGATDDTAAIQSAITTATAAGKVVFIDYGLYLITSTIKIPAGARIVGETYPVLLASGAAFTDINNPTVLLQVGAAGEVGSVEFSDFVVSGQGATAGATLIEYNLASPAGSPSGFWDVHTRVGGFTGSQLQVAQCLKTPGSSAVDTDCIATYMNLHATSGSSGLYMENCWLWTADHDIDDAANTQITLYSGRGLFIESTAGSFWLVGTAVEHHVLYQYQLADTVNVFASQLQTEAPYFHPLPNALVPFPVNDALQDPPFAGDCDGVAGHCEVAWGLRVLSSSDLFVYGSNHYSWFDNYSQNCSTFATGESCQARIVRLQGTNSNLNVYSLNTIGSTSMIDNAGTEVANWADNTGVYQSNIISFRTG